MMVRRPACALWASAGKETGDDFGPEEPFCLVMTGVQTLDGSERDLFRR